MIDDIICPLCPECDSCGQWAGVPELRELRDEMGVTTLKSDNTPCPNLGDTGCVLLRVDRPKMCNSYICEKGYQAWLAQ